MENMETKMTNMKADMDAKLETVNNEVKELKTAFVEAFDEMKDVLVKMENNIKENARKEIGYESDDTQYDMFRSMRDNTGRRNAIHEKPPVYWQSTSTE